MMYFMQKKQNFILTAMEMLVFTWPISWMNIIGMPTEYLQLPWFYVFGLFIFIYTLWNFKKFYLREQNGLLMIIFIAFFIYSIWVILFIINIVLNKKIVIIDLNYIVIFLSLGLYMQILSLTFVGNKFILFIDKLLLKINI